jgi:excisionase family DNA binding protein
MSCYLTVKQVATMLNVGPATVYDMCRAGVLPHKRFGCGRGVIRITQAALDRYIQQSEASPARTV